MVDENDQLVAEKSEPSMGPDQDKFVEKSGSESGIGSESMQSESMQSDFQSSDLS